MKLTLRIWILIIVLFLALLSIAPWGYFEKGAIIKSVEQNSTVSLQGLHTGEIISSINSEQVNNVDDYTRIITKIFLVENKTNPTTQNKTKLTIVTDKNSYIFFTDQAPEITVANIPVTKIKTGLDLSGGARALVKPEKQLSLSEMNDLIAVTSNRLNVFGISDVTIRPVTDLSGSNFMLVEVAGATPTDLRDLVSKQGKFEARIGNETAFRGGNADITSVCRNDASCAGIYSCSPSSGNSYFCNFRFTIYLSEEAAKKHAEITDKLNINSSLGGSYLDKKLDLFLDDNLLDSLLISSDLKGKVTTQISVQGSGKGATQQEAYEDAKQSMNKLQTILITGSLPYKLDIVKIDTISPLLGKEFTRNIITLALIVFAIVSIVLFIKYRKIKITLSVILTMFSEALITIGIASLIRWNLDAPSIAGIIAGMGTGVNDQIVIIDEAVSTEEEGIKLKIKRAFFIIIGAFFTIIAAMLPLFWAGAGMLRGFALTTIIGVSVGILITRPAFSDILKKIQS